MPRGIFSKLFSYRVFRPCRKFLHRPQVQWSSRVAMPFYVVSVSLFFYCVQRCLIWYGWVRPFLFWYQTSTGKSVSLCVANSVFLFAQLQKMRSRDSHSVLLRFWTAIEDDFMLFLKGSLKCLYFTEDCFRDKIVKNFLLFFLSTQRCGWKCHRFDKMVFIESGAFTNTIGFKMC